MAAVPLHSSEPSYAFDLLLHLIALLGTVCEAIWRRWNLNSLLTDAVKNSKSGFRFSTFSESQSENKEKVNSAVSTQLNLLGFVVYSKQEQRSQAFSS